MNQIIDYITELNWADNWMIYIVTGVLLFWLGILLLKYLVNKVKSFGILILIALVLGSLSYMAFLAGFIDFDIVSFIGFEAISDKIVSVIETIGTWFKNVFSF